MVLTAVEPTEAINMLIHLIILFQSKVSIPKLRKAFGKRSVITLDLFVCQWEISPD